jgi:integrase
MPRHSANPLTLYARDGRRKYLTHSERKRFIATAANWPDTDLGTLCLVLAHTGCRLSEALSLTRCSVDPAEGFVAILSLKKRGSLLVREIPVPPDLLERLALLEAHRPEKGEARLWSWRRVWAWHLIKRVMAAADIPSGPHATPKGLRHAFGIHAIRSNVPLNLVQRWLGHASLSTTAIYADALGPEEREIAARMWVVERKKHA